MDTALASRYSNSMRNVMALFLSLILAVASQVEAEARVEMAGATDFVVCGAAGATSITLDGAGRVIHAHSCTHCLAAAAAAADLAAGLAWAPVPVTRTTRLRLTVAAQVAPVTPYTPAARGPPPILA